MLKATLFTFLLFVCSVAIAQKKLFINPNIGFGISSISSKQYYPYVDLKPLPVWSAEVKCGLQYKHFRISTGLTVFTTGIKVKDVFQYKSLPPIIDTIVIKYVSTHLGIPVCIGYSIHISEKISIEPELTLTPSYHMGTRFSGKSAVMGNSPAERFEANNWFILYGWVNLNFRYKINPQVSLVVGPSFTHVINNIWPVGSLNGDTNESQYAITGRAGIMITL